MSTNPESTGNNPTLAVPLASTPGDGGTGSIKKPSKESTTTTTASTSTFLVGRDARRELRRTLVRSTDPAATIQAIQQNHSLHSMMAKAFGTVSRHHETLGEQGDGAANHNDETRSGDRKRSNGRTDLVETLDTDSVMLFLSHLGLTQFEVHKKISDTLLKHLEDDIRKVKTEGPLLDLLSNCWTYATKVPELRPVLWTVLKQLGERTPLAVLKALSERETGTKAANNDNPKGLKHADIFKPLPPLLKRLCFEADWDTRIPIEPDVPPSKYLPMVQQTLFFETVWPHIRDYLSNELLVSIADSVFVPTIRECRVLTTQRRAIVASTVSSNVAAIATTTHAPQGSSHTAVSTSSLLLRGTKTQLQPQNQQLSTVHAPTGEFTSGKCITQLRNLIGDASGTAMSYRPKLLYAILSMLMARHGDLIDSKEYLAGAEHLHCTLVADILLSAGGTLPKGYQDLLNLARLLDECVQEGNMTDESLVKVQATLAIIFQPASNEEDAKETAPKTLGVEEKKVPGDEIEATSNAEKRQLNKLITAGLHAMKEADPQSLFLNPVTDAIAPGYSKVIKKPMCIHEMEEKVRRNEYNSLSTWEADVRLMFKNCIDYNRGKAGQWFRGEANRQSKVFQDEILKQAKTFYQQEIAKRIAAREEVEERKRKVEEKISVVSPLQPSVKKRKRVKDEYLPSMPALASMLLADPFVVKILISRTLRDLRRGVIGGTTLPASHSSIPSILQLLHIARWSPQHCSIKGRRFFVPDSGLGAPPKTDDPTVSVPFVSLRCLLPILVRLFAEAELDKRISPGGDLFAAAQTNSMKPEPIVESQFKEHKDVEVAKSLLQGLFVHVCQPGQGNEVSLSTTFPKFGYALQTVSSLSLPSDRVFFISLKGAILKHRSKLPRITRDAIVRSWLAWLRCAHGETGSMTSAAHEYFVALLNDWASLGNLLLTRDNLREFTTECVEAANASETSPTRQFAAMWMAGDEDFRGVMKQYEIMLHSLPPGLALSWKQGVGIDRTGESAEDV